MKKLLVGLIITGAISFGTSCSPKSDSTTDDKKESKVNTQRLDSLRAVKKQMDSLRIDSLNKRLTVLEKKFIKNIDEFDKTGWYTHKTWKKNILRSYLSATVFTSGRSYLESNYHGEDWVFHTYLSVLIEDTTYRTAEVPSYSDLNRRDHYHGTVTEQISFSGGKDKGIYKMIAENYNKTIKVRFFGKSYEQITLSKKDKLAIKDSYELKTILKELKELKK